MTLNCAYLGTVLLVAALGSTGEATLYLDDHCGETIRVHGDRMYSQSTKNYDNNMDCLVTIQAPYDYQIVTIDFSWVDLFNRGCYDYIEICDTNGTLLNTICANWEPRDIYSSGNFIYIRMVTDDSRVDRGFSLVFTAFHYDYDLACNDTYEFKCSGNDRCIDDSLVCDDKNNCNNAYDEDDCSEIRGWLILLVVFALIGIVAAIIYVVYYSCTQKKKEESTLRISPVTITRPEADYSVVYEGQQNIAMTTYPHAPPPYSTT